MPPEVRPVWQVLRYLRLLVEQDRQLVDLWVAGEISNLTLAASGHIYFTLKDQGGSLRCVFFRGKNAGQRDRARGNRIARPGQVRHETGRACDDLYHLSNLTDVRLPVPASGASVRDRRIVDDFEVVGDLCRLPQHDRGRAIFFRRELNRTLDLCRFDIGPGDDEMHMNAGEYLGLRRRTLGVDFYRAVANLLAGLLQDRDHIVSAAGAGP